MSLGFRPLSRILGTRRRGSVLIICAGVLAVLMVFGATLALMARVEVRASRNYTLSRMGDRAAQSVLTYACAVMTTDKYGGDTVPYNYDLAAAGDPTPGWGVDEGYDAASPDPATKKAAQGYDEWLTNFGATSNSEQWGVANGLFSADTASPAPAWRDGTDLLTENMGTDLAEAVRMRYALAIFDAGAVASVNDCGNTAGTALAHAANEGVSAAEISLETILGDLGGTSAMAQGLIDAREGVDNAPGTLGTADPDVASLVSSYRDNDGDGDLTDEATPTDVPQEFQTGNPLGDDWPFGVFSLDELVVQPVLNKRWGAVFSAPTALSRAGTIVPAAQRYVSGGVQPVFSPYVSTWGVGGYNVWTEVAAGPTYTLRGQGPVIPPTGAGLPAALQWVTWPVRPGDTGVQLLARRTPDQVFGGTSLTVANIYSFIDAVTPTSFVKLGGSSVTDVATRERILKQTAVNLRDFVDKNDYDADDVDDALVTVYNDGTRDFFGVETVPYITEMGLALSLNAGTGSTEAYAYIKLVNPWDVAIPANRYQVKGGTWQILKDDVDGDAPDIAWGDFVVNVAIPARGVLLVATINNDAAGKALLGGLFNADGSAGDTYTLLPAAALMADLGALTTEKITVNGIQATLAQLRDGAGTYATIQTFARDAGGGAAALSIEWPGGGPYTGGTVLRLTDSRYDDAPAVAPVWPDPRPTWITSGGALRDYPWVYHFEQGANIANGRPFTYNLEWLTGTAPTFGAGAYERGDGWAPGVSSVTKETDYSLSKLGMWGSFPLAATHTSNDWLQWRVMNRADTISNIGYLGFVPTGIPWCTVGFTDSTVMAGLQDPSAATPFGDVVCLNGVLEYLVAPKGPYNDGFNNDGDAQTDQADVPTDAADRAGPEVRERGQMNVNNASETAMAGLLSTRMLDNYWAVTSQAGAIDYTVLRTGLTGGLTGRRAESPFTTVGDVLRRWHGATAGVAGNVLHPNGTGFSGGEPTRIYNTFAAEHLARSVSNLVTVRSDQFLVVGRVQVHAGTTSAPTEIYSERRFAAVVDRSYDPVRVLLFRWLTD
jgi:hypothetical protein